MPSGTPAEAWGIAGPRAAKVSNEVTPYVVRIAADLDQGRSKDGLYEPALADSEREAVADLLQYLENVRVTAPHQGNLS